MSGKSVRNYRIGIHALFSIHFPTIRFLPDIYNIIHDNMSPQKWPAIDGVGERMVSALRQSTTSLL